MDPWVVVGLGAGDEGKGSIVDFLTRKVRAKTVVRFNGGAQAAHAVVLDDGRDHVFSQFGSGTLAGARTVLTKHVVVDPLALAVEAKHLSALGIADPLSLVTVDERALVSTPLHAAANRAREAARGEARHGSCGVGVGEAVADSLGANQDIVIRVVDLRRPAVLREKIAALWSAKVAELPTVGATWAMFDGAPDLMASAMVEVGQKIRIAGWDEVAAEIRRGPTIYEGAQGVLLDEWHGFHPHTTWSTTTPDNALACHFAAEAPGQPRVLGVLRAYHTRHGEGPFPSENVAIMRPPGEHNGDAGQQGRFRVGALDLVLARYAVAAARAVRYLAVTCLDHPTLGVCRAYDDGPRLPGRPISIAPAFDRDLERQRRLGEYLRGVSPVISPGPDSPEQIAAEVGLTLAVASRGPRAADKDWKVPDK